MVAENAGSEVDACHFYPVILNSDSKSWEMANLFRLDKLKSFQLPKPATLEVIANDLVVRDLAGWLPNA